MGLKEVDIYFPCFHAAQLSPLHQFAEATAGCRLFSIVMRLPGGCHVGCPDFVTRHYINWQPCSIFSCPLDLIEETSLFFRIIIIIIFFFFFFNSVFIKKYSIQT